MGIIIGILWFVLVCLLASAASKKGRSGAGFFFIGLLLSPLVGFIILVVMGENKEKLQQQNLKAGITKKCPFCANEIKKEAIVCQFCNKDVPYEAAPISDTPENAKNGKVLIKRISNDRGASKPIIVSVDNKKKFDFLNGDEKSIDIEGGSHFITVKYDDGSFQGDQKILEFFINDNCINFNISIDPRLKVEKI